MISLEMLSGMGEALKELRWHARMKQVEVCRATGMTAPQVSRYENGREMPTVESLVRYLVAVDADLCDLQRVLVAGKAATRGAASPAADLTRTEIEQLYAKTRAESDARHRMYQEMTEERDRRLDSNSALQEIVSGLVKLNAEGMERMEQRMRSMEQSMADLKKGSDEKSQQHPSGMTKRAAK